MSYELDSELAAFMPHNPNEEELRASIRATRGVFESHPVAAVVWEAPDGRRLLLDGYTRDRICKSEGLACRPREVTVHLPDRVSALHWMQVNQDARRSLTVDQRIQRDVDAGIECLVKAPSLIEIAKLLREKAPDLADRVVGGKSPFTLNRAKNEYARRSAVAETPKSFESRTPVALKGRIHFVIGDTQVREGVPTEHLTWIGQYLVDQFAGQDVAVIHLGDHWDMPSLSSYDLGKKSAEGRRYKIDIDAGNKGFDLLCAPLKKYNEGRTRQWNPERHFLLGNHEDRITRACEDAANLDGTLSLEDLNAKSHGWTVHPFKQPVDIDGVAYAHYFYHHNTGKPFSGENLGLRLKTIGRSFTMGHQQGVNYSLRAVGPSLHQGLVLGSTYLHEEEYKGPQATAYWRGIVVCHQVENGTYDPMFVSLDFLCRKYERKTLADFMKAERKAA